MFDWGGKGKLFLAQYERFTGFDSGIVTSRHKTQKFMSWTDVFPVLTDEQVEEYLTQALSEEKKTFEDFFRVEKVANSRTVADGKQQVVAASLFWKNTRANDPDLPQLSRELLKNANKLGLVKRFAPWEHYVQPLLDGAEALAQSRPEIIFRVYLAADLEFLIADFVELNCEVHLMKSSSVRHNPGAMWRFLALEHDGLVTITDSDRAGEVIHDIERTELVVEHGLGHWRIPYIWGEAEYDSAHYRTVMACQFGSSMPIPTSILMPAMLWHTWRGTLARHCSVDGGETVDAFGSNWPDYGFDEWFMNVAVFPRIAFAGVLTFIQMNDRRLNHWFALDIEYVTWANPKSEIFYYNPPTIEEAPPANLIEVAVAR